MTGRASSCRPYRDGVSNLPSNEHELWDCAALMIKKYGDLAPGYIAQQIGALAQLGDDRGAEDWRSIAGKMVQLSRPGLRH